MLHYAPVWCSVGRRAQEVLALPRPVEPSLDLIPAKVRELAPGIHYWKEEEGASPRAFLSQSTLVTNPESRLGPCRYTQVY